MKKMRKKTKPTKPNSNDDSPNSFFMKIFFRFVKINKYINETDCDDDKIPFNLLPLLLLLLLLVSVTEVLHISFESITLLSHFSVDVITLISLE